VPILSSSAGHAKHAGLAAVGSDGAFLGRIVIVVDVFNGYGASLPLSRRAGRLTRGTQGALHVRLEN
jgi:hypothetical protein